MPAIDRDGVSIGYDADGSGPAIQFSHGYGATREMWDGQLAALRDRYRLIRWDMRGHGQSDSPDDPSLYSEAATVADMAAILDAEGAETAILAGLSLGGYMSLAFYLLHPERVRALLLFDTGPGYNNPKGRESWNQDFALRRARAFEERGLDAVGRSPEVALATHRSAQGLAHAARGMLAQFDDRVIRSLPNVGVPTLVLVGADDQQFLAAADYMADKIPDARKVVIPDAGHAANVDQPEAFNAAVVEFLGGL